MIIVITFCSFDEVQLLAFIVFDVFLPREESRRARAGARLDGALRAVSKKEREAWLCSFVAGLELTEDLEARIQAERACLEQQSMRAEDLEAWILRDESKKQENIPDRLSEFHIVDRVPRGKRDRSHVFLLAFSGRLRGNCVT